MIFLVIQFCIFRCFAIDRFGRLQRGATIVIGRVRNLQNFRPRPKAEIIVPNETNSVEEVLTYSKDCSDCKKKEIICIARGYPEPTVTWVLDGIDLVSDLGKVALVLNEVQGIVSKF